MNNSFKQMSAVLPAVTNGKKILFACVPADGHFNPLTGLAVHLKSIGYDVRWYTSKEYAPKLEKLQIPHYRFKKALEVTGDSVDEIFPDRHKHKSQVAKLNYDLVNFFIARSTEYFADILTIRESFKFDLMIADCTFTAIPFVKEKLNIPVIAVGIIPLTETSKNLPPSGLGLVPSKSIFGKIKESVLRLVADKILFKKSNEVLRQLCYDNCLSYEGQNVFDFLTKKATLFLQSGTPGFEFERSDLGKNIRYVGALLPYSANSNKQPWFDERLNKYEKVILVTQGTVEKDVSKLIIPTLDAFKETDVLLIVTTGGSETQSLREKYPYANIIIEDYIPFADVMPYCDVYVSNGGYGGVLLSIENRVPMVVAGVHEGKIEINARVGYFKLGVNLKTETPKSAQVRKAVQTIFDDATFKQNVVRLAAEFESYDAKELTQKHVAQLIETKTSVLTNKEQVEVVY
jgi:UDP:flavonoid glycosyltransferase YjiC (YdhE family)